MDEAERLMKAEIARLTAEVAEYKASLMTAHRALAILAKRGEGIVISDAELSDAPRGGELHYYLDPRDFSTHITFREETAVQV